MSQRQLALVNTLNLLTENILNIENSGEDISQEEQAQIREAKEMANAVLSYPTTTPLNDPAWDRPAVVKTVKFLPTEWPAQAAELIKEHLENIIAMVSKYAKKD